MSNVGKIGSTAVLKCDEDMVFRALAELPRRKLLLALASGGPQSGWDLRQAGKARKGFTTEEHYRDSTLKHLKQLVEAGIVVQTENPQDRRRPLYALAPGVKVSVVETGTQMDFGFCMVELSADGN